MLVLGIAVAIVLVLPLLTGGSYSRLVMIDWRWSAALFVGLGLQLALEFLPIPESRWDDLGFGLLLVSYALIIAFCARNVLLRGMAIVLIGVACNTLVIGLNHGMPVDLPPDLAKTDMFEPTVKHHPQDADDRLTFLGDMIVLRSPFDAALSFGDLIIAVGLCDVTYHASRRRKPRRISDVHPAARGRGARQQRRDAPRPRPHRPTATRRSTSPPSPPRAFPRRPLSRRCCSCRPASVRARSRRARRRRTAARFAASPTRRPAAHRSRP